jgi:hypothetical protein
VRFPCVVLTVVAVFVTTAAVARQPPPPVCKAGKYTVPAGILVDPQTPTTKTIVIAGASTVTIPNVCPEVVAKFTATRKGTRVVARWAKGACTGMQGVVRLTALIKSTCDMMQATLHAKKLHRTFSAALVTCDSGLVQDASGACVPVPFQTGSVTAAVTLNAQGCLVGATGFSTSLGVRATIAAGSCFHTVDGDPITGGVELGIDDGGGVAGFNAGADVKGIVRLRLRPTGGNVVAATIDPPATVDIDLGTRALPGTWYTEAYLAGDRFTPAPASGLLAVTLDAVPMEATGREHLRVDATIPLALSFAPVPTTSAAVTTGATTVSIGLPGAATDTDPRVCTWQVANPATGQVIVTGSSVDGLTLNQSDTRIRAGHAYTASIVPSAGTRRLQVTSDFRNAFTLSATLCDGSPVVDTTTGGCPGETCTDGPYVGLVRATVEASSLPDVTTARDALEAHAPAPARVAVRRITTRQDGGFEAIIDVESPPSVHVLASSLPSTWQLVPGDRTLGITVSAPPPKQGGRIVKRVSQASVQAVVSGGVDGSDGRQLATPSVAPYDFGTFNASLPASVSGDPDSGGHVVLGASVLHESELDVTGTDLHGVSGTVTVTATDGSTGLLFEDPTSTATAQAQTDVWFEVEGGPLQFTATLDYTSAFLCEGRIALSTVTAEGGSTVDTVLFDTDDQCDEATYPVQMTGTLPVGHYLFHAEGDATVSANGGIPSNSATSAFGLSLGS